MKSEKIEIIRQNSPTFFLGANSSKGFKSCFHKACDVNKGERLYVIKGGPGTGKSTLIKKIVENICENGEKVELIPCSTDINSLDGAIFPNLKVAIIDGTSPHVVEPKYFGVSERIIPLTEYLNNDLLEKSSKEIISLCKTNTLLHKKASSLIAGAGELLDDNFSLDSSCVNFKKVVYGAKCTAELLLDERSDKKGKEKLRFLSGITGEGVVYFYDTVKYYANKIIAIEDNLGVVSTIFLSMIRNYALDNGYDIITCPCALFPDKKIDHIIIPEKSLAFCTVNSFLGADKKYTKIIHSNRFKNMDVINSFKERIMFNIKASKELMNTASTFINDAKNIHDLIEEKYISAMDFEGVKYFSNKITKEIVNMHNPS